MKTKDLLKLLKKHGCYLYRNGKKHDIWYSPVTDRQFPIPGHKSEIPTGTLHSILTDAGVSMSEFHHEKEHLHE